MEPFRLELPTGLQVGSVNAYLFTDPEPILVDTGIKREECWPAFRFTGLWMLIGYLDLLEIEGAVRRETVDGVWHYDVSQ